MHNACLSFDRTRVICDYGIYHLTGSELDNPEDAVQAGAIKCKAAWDTEWYSHKDWRDILTAETRLADLKNFQTIKVNSNASRRR